MICLNLLAVMVSPSSLTCPIQVSRISFLTGTPSYDILLRMSADKESNKPQPQLWWGTMSEQTHRKYSFL